MKSFTLGYRVRQASWRDNVVRQDLIDLKALNLMHEDPLDVSRNGCNGTLKSPPTISVPF